MSIFDKFMRTIGFASNNDVEKPGSSRQNKHANSTQKKSSNGKKTGFLEFAPTSQNQILDIAELLKNGAKLRLDLSAFEQADLYRAVDFLEGVCFALDIAPKFFENNVVELSQ